MNERIRELAEQASLHLDDNGDIIWSKTRYNSEVEKFAELIIQECIEIVFESDPSPKMSLQEPYGTIMFNIKDHFGIE